MQTRRPKTIFFTIGSWIESLLHMPSMWTPSTQTCHMCHKLAMEMAQTSNGSKTQSKIVNNVEWCGYITSHLFDYFSNHVFEMDEKI
jgi:hypothetical protein